MPRTLRLTTAGVLREVTAGEVLYSYSGVYGLTSMAFGSIDGAV